MIESRLVILVVGGVIRRMWGQVDISNENLKSPSQVDDDLLVMSIGLVVTQDGTEYWMSWRMSTIKPPP